MMMTAKEEYSAGNLQGAMMLITEEIRKSPSDASKRAFFVELLCANGELERADQQLNTLLTMEPQFVLTIGTWRQLIRAAQSRMDVYEKGAIPDVIEKPTERIRLSLELLVAKRAGDMKAATQLISAINELPLTTGFKINDTEVTDWRDLDDLNAGILELLGSNGKYFWIDFDQIESIEFDAPIRPLDLLWRRVSITMSNGSVGEAFVPTIYPHFLADDATKLGRKTEWHEECGLVLGQGLRTWLVGEQVSTVLELANVEKLVLEAVNA